jgi:imidazolonepropionase-like amidohydrolase
VYIIPTLITLQRALKLGEQQGWAKNLLTFKNIQEEVMSVYDANIPILAGTDPPNFDINYGNDLLKEIQLLAESGLLPIDALKAATSNIAIEFDIPNLGFIKKGEEANFIIVNGDPTQYISSIENIESIWKNGIKINEP